MEKVCKVCGKPVGKGRRSFCSDECSKKFYTAKFRTNQAMKCLICGQPLPKGYKKYCSEACRNEAETRRMEVESKTDAQILDLIQVGKVARGLNNSDKNCALNYARQYGNSKLDKTLEFINRINIPYHTYRYWRDFLHRSDEEIESLWVN